MRILLCMPEYPPDSIGGGGHVAEALFKEFSKRHEVRVLTAGIGVAAVPKNESSSIVRIPAYPYPRSLTFMASTMPPRVQYLPRVFSEVHGFDVAHVHGYGFPLMDAIVFASRLRRIPVVKTLHGFPVTPDKLGGHFALALRAYSGLLGDPALRAAAQFTAVSRHVADFYSDRYGIQCAVVPNGVTDIPHADAAVRREESKFTVLCVGRIEWLKRFDTVIEALGKLPRLVRLRIAGRDNGAKTELEALAKRLGVEDRVEFLGYIAGKDLANAFAQADCCVMSSETEAFPAVPLEAMRQGVPLVATPVGGTNEYGVDGRNLLFYPIGDADALARRIEVLLKNPAAREQLISYGHQTASTYSWDAVARQYEGIFESVKRG